MTGASVTGTAVGRPFAAISFDSLAVPATDLTLIRVVATVASKFTCAHIGTLGPSAAMACTVLDVAPKADAHVSYMHIHLGDGSSITHEGASRSAVVQIAAVSDAQHCVFQLGPRLSIAVIAREAAYVFCLLPSAASTLSDSRFFVYGPETTVDLTTTAVGTAFATTGVISSMADVFAVQLFTLRRSALAIIGDTSLTLRSEDATRVYYLVNVHVDYSVLGIYSSMTALGHQLDPLTGMSTVVPTMQFSNLDVAAADALWTPTAVHVGATPPPLPALWSSTAPYATVNGDAGPPSPALPSFTRISLNGCVSAVFAGLTPTYMTRSAVQITDCDVAVRPTRAVSASHSLIRVSDASPLSDSAEAPWSSYIVRHTSFQVLRVRYVTEMLTPDTPASAPYDARGLSLAASWVYNSSVDIRGTYVKLVASEIGYGVSLATTIGNGQRWQMSMAVFNSSFELASVGASPSVALAVFFMKNFGGSLTASSMMVDSVHANLTGYGSTALWIIPTFTQLSGSSITMQNVLAVVAQRPNAQGKARGLALQLALGTGSAVTIRNHVHVYVIPHHDLSATAPTYSMVDLSESLDVKENSLVDVDGNTFLTASAFLSFGMSPLAVWASYCATPGTTPRDLQLGAAVGDFADTDSLDPSGVGLSPSALAAQAARLAKLQYVTGELYPPPAAALSSKADVTLIAFGAEPFAPLNAEDTSRVLFRHNVVAGRWGSRTARRVVAVGVTNSHLPIVVANNTIALVYAPDGQDTSASDSKALVVASIVFGGYFVEPNYRAVNNLCLVRALTTYPRSAGVPTYETEMLPAGGPPYVAGAPLNEGATGGKGYSNANFYGILIQLSDPVASGDALDPDRFVQIFRAQGNAINVLLESSFNSFQRASAIQISLSAEVYERASLRVVGNVVNVTASAGSRAKSLVTGIQLHRVAAPSATAEADPRAVTSPTSFTDRSSLTIAGNAVFASGAGASGFYVNPSVAGIQVMSAIFLGADERLRPGRNVVFVACAGSLLALEPLAPSVAAGTDTVPPLFTPESFLPTSAYANLTARQRWTSVSRYVSAAYDSDCALWRGEAAEPQQLTSGALCDGIVIQSVQFAGDSPLTFEGSLVTVAEPYPGWLESDGPGSAVAAQADALLQSLPFTNEQVVPRSAIRLDSLTLDTTAYETKLASMLPAAAALYPNFFIIAVNVDLVSSTRRLQPGVGLLLLSTTIASSVSGFNVVGGGRGLLITGGTRPAATVGDSGWPSLPFASIEANGLGGAFAVFVRDCKLANVEIVGGVTSAFPNHPPPVGPWLGTLGRDTAYVLLVARSAVDVDVLPLAATSTVATWDARADGQAHAVRVDKATYPSSLLADPPFLFRLFGRDARARLEERAGGTIVAQQTPFASPWVLSVTTASSPFRSATTAAGEPAPAAYYNASVLVKFALQAAALESEEPGTAQSFGGPVIVLTQGSVASNALTLRHLRLQPGSRVEVVGTMLSLIRASLRLVVPARTASVSAAVALVDSEMCQSQLIVQAVSMVASTPAMPPSAWLGNSTLLLLDGGGGATSRVTGGAAVTVDSNHLSAAWMFQSPAQIRPSEVAEVVTAAKLADLVYAVKWNGPLAQATAAELPLVVGVNVLNATRNTVTLYGFDAIVRSGGAFGAPVTLLHLAPFDAIMNSPLAVRVSANRAPQSRSNRGIRVGTAAPLPVPTTPRSSLAWVCNQFLDGSRMSPSWDLATYWRGSTTFAACSQTQSPSRSAPATVTRHTGSGTRSANGTRSPSASLRPTPSATETTTQRDTPTASMNPAPTPSWRLTATSSLVITETPRETHTGSVTLSDTLTLPVPLTATPRMQPTASDSRSLATPSRRPTRSPTFSAPLAVTATPVRAPTSTHHATPSLSDSHTRAVPLPGMALDPSLLRYSVLAEPPPAGQEVWPGTERFPGRLIISIVTTKASSDRSQKFVWDCDTLLASGQLTPRNASSAPVSAGPTPSAATAAASHRCAFSFVPPLVLFPDGEDDGSGRGEGNAIVACNRTHLVIAARPLDTGETTPASLVAYVMDQQNSFRSSTTSDSKLPPSAVNSSSSSSLLQALFGGANATASPGDAVASNSAPAPSDRLPPVSDAILRSLFTGTGTLLVHRAGTCVVPRPTDENYTVTLTTRLAYDVTPVVTKAIYAIPAVRGAESTAVVSTVAAAMVGNPAVAAQVSRMAMILALSTCDGSLPDLGMMDNPMRFSITFTPSYALDAEGDPLPVDASAPYLGAIWGNVILFSIFACAQLLIAEGWFQARRWRQRTGSDAKPRSRLNCIADTRCPGLLSVPGMTLLQPTVMCATILLGNDPNGAHIISAMSALALVGAATAAIAVLTWPKSPFFHGCFVASKAKITGPALYFNAFISGLHKWYVDKSMKKRGVLWVRHFGFFFMDYNDRARWFFLVEIVFSIVLGIIGGITSANSAVCQSLAVLTLITYVIYLAMLMGFRPSVVPFNTVTNFIVAPLQCIGVVAVLCLLFGDRTNATAMTIATQCPIAAAYVALVKQVLDTLLMIAEGSTRILSRLLQRPGMHMAILDRHRLFGKRADYGLDDGPDDDANDEGGDDPIDPVANAAAPMSLTGEEMCVVSAHDDVAVSRDLVAPLGDNDIVVLPKFCRAGRANPFLELPPEAYDAFDAQPLLAEAALDRTRRPESYTKATPDPFIAAFQQHPTAESTAAVDLQSPSVRRTATRPSANPLAASLASLDRSGRERRSTTAYPPLLSDASQRPPLPWDGEAYLRYREQRQCMEELTALAAAGGRTEVDDDAATVSRVVTDPAASRRHASLPTTRTSAAPPPAVRHRVQAVLGDSSL